MYSKCPSRYYHSGGCRPPHRPGQAQRGSVHSSSEDDAGRRAQTDRTSTTQGKSPDFDYIRSICETDAPNVEVDLSPQAFKHHRQSWWPSMAASGPSQLVRIYELVRESGLPNAIGCKIPIPSDLNITAWRQLLGDTEENRALCDYLKFGFPLGYLGPVSNTVGMSNHPSARQFPEQVAKFIQKEKNLGALIGPFTEPPFVEWAHVSPIMSLPKSDPTQRRIITDLTFPRDQSVNAYIRKNTIMGEERCHSLPTVDAVVQRVVKIGAGAHIFTVDVSRAYKNFRTCPLDWPLLNIEWEGQFYTEISMPFGARASSSSMQRIADAIVHVLAKRGVVAHMYLDDIVVVTATKEEGLTQYRVVADLLKELGLPEATEKTQMPATKVRWLGITVDSDNMTLSIPKEKLNQTLAVVDIFATRRSINRKQLQSLIGKLLHVAKCIHPARVFVARLLAALRSMTSFYIPITHDMRADLAWFQEFGRSWNGVAMIPNHVPTKTILVDACLTGIGGADDRRAYAARVARQGMSAANIAHLEAVNIVVAMHTLLTPADRGGHIVIRCDNSAAVSVFQTGRGRDPFLLECARAAWMAQAIFNIQVTYKHIAGANNTLADALSRAHTSHTYDSLAKEIVNKYDLQWCTPCLHILDIVTPSFVHRSSPQHAGGQGGGQAAEGQSTGHNHQQAVGRHQVPSVLPRTQYTAGQGQSLPYMHVYRGSGRPATLPADYHEPHGTCQGALHPRGGNKEPCRPLQGFTSDAGNKTPERLLGKALRTPDTHRAAVSHGIYRETGNVQSQGRDSHNVLWRSQVGRAAPAYSGVLRSTKEPHQGRRVVRGRQPYSQGETRQEHAVLQSIQADNTQPLSVCHAVPIGSSKVSPQTHPNSGKVTTNVCVPSIAPPCPRIVRQEALDRSAKTFGYGPNYTHNALHQENGGHGRIR